MTPPNTRVQRTRSSPSAPRSPLTRHPLGVAKGTVAIWPRASMSLAFGLLSLVLTAEAVAASQPSPSADSPAALIEMPYVRPSQTPAHFKWPMKFRVSVDTRGRATSVEYLGKQPDVQPYVDGLKRARFSPARRAGRAVADVFVVTLNISDMQIVPRTVLAGERQRTPTP